MEKWRRVWRFGLCPQFSSSALHALKAALVNDDPRIIQGRVSHPMPLEALRQCEIEGACAIGFCGWQAKGLSRVGDVEDYFHRVCEAADARFHETAACRFFLNWFDDTPRAVMRRELLAEVRLALNAKKLAAA